jgi:co-chaperonin GroES (HSP10)
LVDAEPAVELAPVVSILINPNQAKQTKYTRTGRVAAIGNEVTNVQVGQRIFFFAPNMFTFQGEDRDWTMLNDTDVLGIDPTAESLVWTGEKWEPVKKLEPNYTFSSEKQISDPV